MLLLMAGVLHQWAARSEAQPPGPATSRPAESISRTFFESWGEGLIWLLVLVIVFAAAALAIIRFSRHYRAMLIRRTTTPTANADVWRMHRLADEERADSNEDGG